MDPSNRIRTNEWKFRSGDFIQNEEKMFQEFKIWKQGGSLPVECFCGQKEKLTTHKKALCARIKGRFGELSPGLHRPQHV